jgi:Tfp pilus assembly protein PilF
MAELRDIQKLGALSARLRPGERADPDALVGAAMEAMRLSAHENAAALLDAALLSDPRHPRAWAARGMLEEREGRLDDATRSYETALALDDTDALSALALAQIYARKQEADRARALLD